MMTPQYTNCPTCKHYYGTYCTPPNNVCKYELLYSTYPLPLNVSGGTFHAIPTITIPLSVLQTLSTLAKTDGVNAKAQIAEIIDGLLKENLNELEKKAVFK